MEVFEVIEARRSHSRLVEPGPDKDEVLRIVGAAASAPDHGRLQPWRVIALSGAAKDEFGQVLVDAYLARAAAAGEDTHEAKVAKERTKLARAPVVLVVAATPRPNTKIPFLEQFAATAAAVQNALLAATAIGYGTMWRTGEATYDESVKQALGLGEDDIIVGFLYLGTVPAGEVRPRTPPAVSVDDRVEFRS